MLLNDCPKRKCVTIPLANTAPYTSARIIISYYSSTQKKPYKYVQRLYLKHGPLVVSTFKFPKESAHHTLRVMLTAVCLYPKFLKCVPSVHSAYILKGWVKAFCKVNARKYMRLPLATLLKEASYSMENLKSLMFDGRLTLTSIPNVEDTLINLHTNVLIATEFMIQRGVYSRPVKQHSLWRKK